jgi:Glutamate synthase domain 2
VHGGEYHTYNPEGVKKLQEAVKSGTAEIYKEYAELENNREPARLRDRMELKYPATSKKAEICEKKNPPKKLE